MRTRSYGMALVALVGALASTAHAQISNELFASFSRCDASFFKLLNARPIDNLAASDVSRADGVAWIRVPNRQGKTAARLRLPPSTTLAGLTVAEYIDDITDLEFAGLYFTWGFSVKAPVETVRQALLPHVFQSERLIRDNNAYARIDVKVGPEPWQRGEAPAAGSAPTAQHRVERTFLIERDDDPERTLVSCNLQGKVEPELLKEIRPDIPANQYPKKGNAKL